MATRSRRAGRTGTLALVARARWPRPAILFRAAKAGPAPPAENSGPPRHCPAGPFDGRSPSRRPGLRPLSDGAPHGRSCATGHLITSPPLPPMLSASFADPWLEGFAGVLCRCPLHRVAGDTGGIVGISVVGRCVPATEPKSRRSPLVHHHETPTSARACGEMDLNGRVQPSPGTWRGVRHRGEVNRRDYCDTDGGSCRKSRGLKPLHDQSAEPHEIRTDWRSRGRV